MDVEEIECAGAGEDSDHQLADDGRNPEAATERGDDFAGREQNREEQRELENLRHSLPGEGRVLLAGTGEGAADAAEWGAEERQQPGVAASFDTGLLHRADGSSLAAGQF